MKREPGVQSGGVSLPEASWWSGSSVHCIPLPVNRTPQAGESYRPILDSIDSRHSSIVPSFARGARIEPVSSTLHCDVIRGSFNAPSGVLYK